MAVLYLQLHTEPSSNMHVHVIINRVAMVMVSSHLGSDWSAKGETGIISSRVSRHDDEGDDDKSGLVVDAGY